MDPVYLYLIAVAVLAIVVYACIRWIDFGFTKAEDKRRYKMAKGCIRCYNDGQKQMAKSLIRNINNNLFKMCQEMSDL